MPPPLRVATWNIHKGVGSDRRRDLFRTAEVIAELAPDLLALQEADRRFGDRAGLLDLDHLHRTCGLIPLLPDTPGPSHGWHGNLLFLRAEAAAMPATGPAAGPATMPATMPATLIEQIHPLPLPGLESRGALLADLTLRGHPLRVLGLHLGLLAASRRAQAHALLDRLARLPPRPTVVMGDLNEWRRTDSASIAPLTRHFVAPPATPSFPARLPVLALDRIMASPGLTLSRLRVHDSPLARRASDHLPVMALLEWP